MAKFRRATKPYNKSAIEKANEELYTNHPDDPRLFDEHGNRKKLDLCDPSHGDLRKEWMDEYAKDGKVKQEEGNICPTCPPVARCQVACGATRWINTQVYCGDNATLECTFSGNPEDVPAAVEILHPTNGSVVETINENMTGGRIRATWVSKAQTANWRTDRIRFRVRAAGHTCDSTNELTFRQRPTTDWILKNDPHQSGNGFADVSEHHDARLETDRVHYNLKLRTDGDPFDKPKKQAAKTLIENVWNNEFSAKTFHRTNCRRGNACDCPYDCCKASFRFDVNFVANGEHILVHIHVTAPGDPTYQSSMGTTDGDWGVPAMRPTISYPHEVGHALGQYDEYPDGAIDPNYTAADPNTQPPDASTLGEPNLMSCDNQTLLNRHYRYALAFLNANSGGDTYGIVA